MEKEAAELTEHALVGEEIAPITVRDPQSSPGVDPILRSVQSYLRPLTENAPHFAIFTLEPGGRVDSWNPGAERVFGYAPVEILGKHFEILFTPEDRASGAPQWEMEQASHAGVAEDERWHRRKGNGTVYLSGLLVALRDESGGLVGFTKIAQDQTDRKRTQEELAESEKRYRELAGQLERRVAERTERLEQNVRTWESFCYSIAHDLRAPLRSISGFAGALLEDYSKELDLTAQEYAARIVASVHRMDEFIGDLLEYGRLAHVELPRSRIELSDALDRALSELGEAVAHSHPELRLEHPLPAVWANPSALNQVLTNVLSNALKFVTPGTTPKLEIRARVDQAQVRLEIKDQGIGILPEHQQRVFELFERLHPRTNYPGTGVGLAIVRKAMERMGGKVGMDSVAGQGTTVWIELPAAEAPAN